MGRSKLLPRLPCRTSPFLWLTRHFINNYYHSCMLSLLLRLIAYHGCLTTRLSPVGGCVCPTSGGQKVVLPFHLHWSHHQDLGLRRQLGHPTLLPNTTTTLYSVSCAEVSLSCQIGSCLLLPAFLQTLLM